MGPSFFKIVAALSAALGAFLVCAARAAEPLAVLPYRLDYSGWFTVSGTIDGKGPFDFIIDTGSTQTLIFTNTAEKIGGIVPTNDPPIRVIGLSASKRFPTYRIGDVSIAGQAMPDLVTVVLKDWTVDGRSPQGVLGLDFLGRYHVEFDAAAKLIRLYARDERYEPPSSQWRASPMTRRTFGTEQGVLYTAEVRLNSARVNFLIDLGATGTIVNKRAAARGRNLGVTISSIRTSSTRIADAVDEKAVARPVYFDRFGIGGTNWRRVVLFVYDAPVIAELGMAGEPFGLIGANLFADRSFAFDFANDRLYISRRIRTE